MEEKNGKIILIIEDEKPLREALSLKLTHEGFTILTASNGEEGLAVAFEKHPDMILLDIIMPQMNGITVLEKLASDHWGKSVPVIVLTNLSDEIKLTENLQGNIVDYLVKSNWDLESIVEKIREKLNM